MTPLNSPSSRRAASDPSASPTTASLAASPNAAGPDLGVEARFDAVVRANYERLRDFVYRYVKSRTTAEDIVQELFAAIWQRADQFNYDDPLPYLYQAARNRALSFLRNERVRERWHAAETARYASGEDVAAVQTAATDTDTVELRAAIAHAVDALPERTRLVFVMHRDQGLSYAEIARVLAISPKTVENQMGRALRMLRARLAPYLPAVVLALAAAAVRLQEHLFG